MSTHAHNRRGRWSPDARYRREMHRLMFANEPERAPYNVERSKAFHAAAREQFGQWVEYEITGYNRIRDQVARGTITQPDALSAVQLLTMTQDDANSPE
jgi:hypothetical protein